ncbi:unnamed protein product [Adineta ricciae]|uniref:Uncharacterized protein n=1 Tax=Adineta ricciae TaxID=249248 RepID=A0A814A908_ADIRI|nr:unnamed protein product [Adineta ricciae]CAF1146356.1 unnamed protein product [Adineta ricciae]
MHLIDKLRASVRRKPTNKVELTLSEQIETLLKQTTSSDRRLQLLRLVYEYRSRQFDILNVRSNDPKREEFEQSMLKSLRAITASLPSKSQSIFQRSSQFYRSMPSATSIQIIKRKTKSV